MQPKDLRGGSPDGLIDKAFNPITGANDITIAVSGDRIAFFSRFRLAQIFDARLIPDTVRSPHSVFETIDGDFLYYRVTSVPDDPRTLFFARVRPTGWRCFVWDFEDPDPYNTSVPKARGEDRMKRRVK